MNAMMGHTLELDDVHTDSKTHIGTVVVPAAWSMAEYLGKTGDEFLLAVICWLRDHGPDRNGPGGLSPPESGMACDIHGRNLRSGGGLAPSSWALTRIRLSVPWAWREPSPSGPGRSWRTEPPTRCFTRARAAASGCEAALLAKAGMTGPEFILTAEDGGLFNNMTNEPKPEMVANGLGEKWYIMEMDNKPYPCCRSTHCTIDGHAEPAQAGAAGGGCGVH